MPFGSALDTTNSCYALQSVHCQIAFAARPVLLHVADQDSAQSDSRFPSHFVTKAASDDRDAKVGVDRQPVRKRRHFVRHAQGMRAFRAGLRIAKLEPAADPNCGWPMGYVGDDPCPVQFFAEKIEFTAPIRRKRSQKEEAPEPLVVRRGYINRVHDYDVVCDGAPYGRRSSS